MSERFWTERLCGAWSSSDERSAVCAWRAAGLFGGRTDECGGRHHDIPLGGCLMTRLYARGGRDDPPRTVMIVLRCSDLRASAGGRQPSFIEFRRDWEPPRA